MPGKVVFLFIMLFILAVSYDESTESAGLIDIINIFAIVISLLIGFVKW